MFVLDQSDSYLWPVSIDLPSNKGKTTFTFDAEFKRLDQQRVMELQDLYYKMLMELRRRMNSLEGIGRDDPSIFDEELPTTYEDLADEVLCGWAKVVDAAGDDVPFSEATKSQMYKVQGATNAIVAAWFKSVGEPNQKAAARAGGFRAKN